MTTYLKKIKRVNSEARILGLDLGRKYVGVAISDRSLYACKVILLHFQFLIAIENFPDRPSTI